MGEPVGLAHLRALTALALVALAAAAHAHEIGTTQVDAHFRRDHTYQIDVVTAPQSLLERLEHRGMAPVGAPELRHRLQQNAATFAKAVDIEFGEERSVPRVEVLPITPDPQRAQSVTMRLTGTIPRDAGAFTWHYGWTFSAYALTSQNEGFG